MILCTEVSRFLPLPSRVRIIFFFDEPPGDHDSFLTSRDRRCIYSRPLSCDLYISAPLIKTVTGQLAELHFPPHYFKSITNVSCRR